MKIGATLKGKNMLPAGARVVLVLEAINSNERSVNVEHSNTIACNDIFMSSTQALEVSRPYKMSNFHLLLFLSCNICILYYELNNIPSQTMFCPSKMRFEKKKKKKTYLQ